jgi:hypothetical protein
MDRCGHILKTMEGETSCNPAYVSVDGESIYVSYRGINTVAKEN